MKLSKKNILKSVIILIVVVGLSVCWFVTGRKTSPKIAVNFTTESVLTEDYKYQFLPKIISDYICDLSAELNIDSDLIVAILMVENPEFNTDATNKNLNGTIDCGLFQLNDRYIWTTFKKDYWFNNVELDPFNWKHNCYLAINHIKYLQKQLKVQDDVIMAYNCGIGAVMNNEIPATTKIYLAKVKNNLFLLKEVKGDAE